MIARVIPINLLPNLVTKDLNLKRIGKKTNCITTDIDHIFAFRFNIWPGYRWDGVDRSNGYEKKLFESIANRHAKSQEAYLWSVEDM